MPAARSFLAYLNRLNGWQRLWLIFSIILLIPFILFSIGILSNTSMDRDMKLAKVKELRAAVYESSSVSVLPVKDQYITEDQAFDYMIDNYEVDKVIAYIESEYKKNSNYYDKISQIDRHYESVFRRDKLYYAFVPLLIWTGIIALVYLAGFALSWIGKGFMLNRQKDSNLDLKNETEQSKEIDTSKPSRSHWLLYCSILESAILTLISEGLGNIMNFLAGTIVLFVGIYIVASIFILAPYLYYYFKGIKNDFPNYYIVVGFIISSVLWVYMCLNP